MILMAGTSHAVAIPGEAHAGVFRPRFDYHVTGDPWAAAIVDPNLDGSPDLMVTQHRTAFLTIDSKLLVMTNDHEGGLTPSVSLPAIEFGGYLTSADFNNDGRLDVAVVTTSDSGQILLNQPDGSWSSTRFREPGDLIYADAADLTGDGYPDLAVCNSATHRVQLFANNGFGGFSLWRNLNVVGSPSGVDFLHINGDGILDMAVSVVTTSLNLLVSRGYGDYERRTSPMPGFQSHVTAVDLDQDGDDDLVMGHLQGSSMWTLANNGDETFGPPVAIAVPAPTRHAVLDFDQDGWPDVAAASVSGVITLLWNDRGTLVRGEDLSSGIVYRGPQVADLDGNGYPDLIGCRSEDDTVSVWLNANGPTTAVLLESVSFVIEGAGVRLVWNLGAGCPPNSCSVERFDPTVGTWEKLGDVVPDGTRVEYLDQGAVAGRRYAYRLETSRCGTLGEIWIDWDRRALNLLAEVWPNPAARVFNVVFDLPRAGDARLELWDLQGRRIEAREVGAMGVGRHTISFGGPVRLSPGIYLVRLLQGDEVATARVTLLD